MHEQWKKRKMFSNREQGIMSGLDPVPMMAGGSVPYPGMQVGGLFIPENENVDPSSKGDTLTEETKILNTMYNDIIKTMLETQTPFESIIENRLSQGSLTFKAAEALKKVFAIQKMRQAQKDSYPKDKGIDFFPSGPPTKKDALEYLDREQKMLQPSYPKMQVGGVVPQPQLFEEGDAEVNDALNMMASVTKPDVPDMPMPMMDEKVEVREEVTQDQGPDGYKGAVSELKNTFKEEIKNYIAQGNSDNLGDYLKNMNMTYTNELDKLKAKFGVEINDPNDKLFDSQLIDEIRQADTIPGMQGGGVVENIASEEDLAKYGINVPIEIWQNMSKAQKETYLFAAIAEQSAKRDTTKVDTSRLAQLLKERRGLAEEAGNIASSAFATTGSAAGEFLGKRAAGKAARASTLDRALADEIAAERAALEAGTSTAGRFNLPADTLNRMILGETPTDMDTTSTYNKLITMFEETSNNPDDAAIAALAGNGALPPISVAPVFHQVITTTDRGDITWPQFYRIELDLLPEEEKTQENKEKIVVKWKNKVGR